MGTTQDYIEFAVSQLPDLGEIRYRKMFGEYMVYINDKPVLLVCDNTVFVKMKEEIAPLMTNADTGVPYNGAKEHYILDIEDREITTEVLKILEKITPIPKKKKKK